MARITIDIPDGLAVEAEEAFAARWPQLTPVGSPRQPLGTVKAQLVKFTKDVIDGHAHDQAIDTARAAVARRTLNIT